MITQVRIYTINRGMMDSWIEVWNTNVVPTSARFGVRVLAAWVNRAQNEFIWVREFETEETLKTYETSPERAVYSPELAKHIAKTEVGTVENALRAAQRVLHYHTLSRPREVVSRTGRAIKFVGPC
jgi:hypothetical protein